MRALRVVSYVLCALFLVGMVAQGQLSGDKYIGASSGSRPGGGDPEYATLSAAFADLNAQGVNGPVTFHLLDVSYSDSVLAIGCTGTSSTNTITIKPYTGVSTTITLTSDAANSIDGGWIIGSPNRRTDNLVPTTYVTIDGSNNGTSSKNLTINGVSTSLQRSVFRIFGNNDNITIKNCIINNNCSNASTNAGINVSNYNAASVNYNPDNLTIDNNTVTSTTGTASTAVHVANSGTPTVGMTAYTLSNNILAGNLRGSFTSYTYDANIFGNTITVASTGATTNLTAYGITVQTNFGTTGIFNIYNNKLTSLTTNCTISGASNGIIGIDNQNTTAHFVNIYNNFIGGFALTGSPNNARIYGIRNTSTSTTTIYHNTIHIPELTNMAASNNIAGIAFATAALSEASPSAASNATVKNNIIKIDESTMTVWGIRRVGVNGTFTSDYNNVYINTGNTAGYYGFDNATSQQTLANWIANTAYDDNSTAGDVVFTSGSDLHLTGGSIGDGTNLTGVAGLGIATDIDDSTRNVTYPYKGADEAVWSPLPVQISSFAVRASGMNAMLSWETATEVDNYGFEVERREISNVELPIANWMKVGFVAGAGNSTSPRSYTFTDQPAPGRYAYRLKQVDRNGQSTYFGEAEVLVGTAPRAISLGENYPNPFNPTTTIEFSVANDGPAALKIYDMTGREIETLFEADVKAGFVNRAVFDARNLSSGIYLYRLQAAGQVVTKRMMLVK